MCYSRRKTAKHIPKEYLTSSYTQRMELLAGLLDTDGHYDPQKGTYIYATCEPALRDGVIQLISTFGWNYGICCYEPKTASSGVIGRRPCYSISFAPKDYVPCVLERKRIEPDADNPDYVKYAQAVLKPIYEANRRDRSDGVMWNCEMVPAENLGVKNASWDKAEKLYVPRDCYNSYFFRVEDPKVNVLDKLKLHGRDFTRYLDGGSACHINLDEHLTREQYALLLRAAIRTGCNYLTFNVPNTLCRSCGYISKQRLDRCPKCGGNDLDYATRVIGYLKLISRFAEARQEEAQRRHYSKGMEDDHEPSD